MLQTDAGKALYVSLSKYAVSDSEKVISTALRVMEIENQDIGCIQLYSKIAYLQFSDLCKWVFHITIFSEVSLDILWPCNSPAWVFWINSVLKHDVCGYNTSCIFYSIIKPKKKLRELLIHNYLIWICFHELVIRIGTTTLWENILLMGKEIVTLPQWGRESQKIVLSLVCLIKQ